MASITLARAARFASSFVALLASAGCAPRVADPPRAGAVDGVESADEARLDPELARALASGAPQEVVVLGRTQLLPPPAGLDAFARAHDGDDRRALRREVVARLVDVARREQPALLDALGRPPVLRRLWIVNAVVVRLGAADVARASRLPSVRYVYRSPDALPPGPDTLVVPGPAPRMPARERFSAAGRRVPWNVERIGAPRVWSESGVSGEGVVVAVIDEGVDAAHPDLRESAWRNAGEIAGNGRDDDGNGYADDARGFDFARNVADVAPLDAAGHHGTMVAGIVAGDGSGGVVTGVAPRARVMALRGARTVPFLLALEYAVATGADVANMSFSVPGLGQLRGLWRLASEHATAAGLVLVGGAGNNGQTAAVPTQIQSPKDAPSVIAVGGVDSTLGVAPFSSAGPVEWGSVALYGDAALPAGLAKPDLAAFPGAGYPVLAPGRGYVDPNLSLRGNSFSGPHVAGVAALVLAARPDLPAWRVKALLEATARDLPPAGRDARTGAGLVDAAAAVRAALADRRDLRGVPR